MIDYWKAIYQIKTILERSRITDESRHSDEFILDLIFQYRASLIQNKFNKSTANNPIWWSNLGLLNVEQVLSSDIPELITTGTLTLGKVYLPAMIPLRYDYHLMNLYTVSQQEKLYPIEYSKFLSYVMVGDVRINNYKHIMIINDYALIYPYTNRIQGRALLQNPREGKTINTLQIQSGDIEVGETYVVRTAQIVYNGVTYSPSDTFVGVAGVTTYTANGKVYLNNSQRAVRMTDMIPISAEDFVEIRLNILTKEYGIEATKIPDMANDSKPESRING